MKWLTELKNRNTILYWFGWYNLVMGIICLLVIPLDDIQILGVSRWVKPMKFFLSVGIMSWTMGWFMYYLNRHGAVRVCSWLIVFTMFFENFIIGMQSLRGTQSHFNERSLFDGILFSIMGLLIVIFTLTIIYVTWMFFRQREFNLPISYLWGIRLGLILFILFSSEGGIMVARMSHTVGGEDGSPGLPIVNWSTRYGDLRIAHFLGIHALQVVPLAGFYLFKTKTSIILFSLFYAAVVVVLILLALNGVPLVP